MLNRSNDKPENTKLYVLVQYCHNQTSSGLMRLRIISLLLLYYFCQSLCHGFKEQNQTLSHKDVSTVSWHENGNEMRAKPTYCSIVYTLCLGPPSLSSVLTTSLMLLSSLTKTDKWVHTLNRVTVHSVGLWWAQSQVYIRIRVSVLVPTWMNDEHG